ncbi:hypothetical protein K2Q00_02990 [Patescibacteria group bacterium]|nr:hypothetical protein [Patescibacteria group bacterium]
MTRLEKVRAEVQKISDDYSVGGHPGVEPGIFDLVVALRYRGFRTVASCQGHCGPNDRMYPWVNVTATNTKFPIVLRSLDQIAAFQPVKKQWKKESKLLKDLIARFNYGPDQNKHPRDEKLCLIDEDKRGATLVPVGAKLLDKFPRELISSTNAELILLRYNRLMKRFAEFLIEDEDTKQHRGHP